MSTTIGEFFLDIVVDAGKGEMTVGNLVKSMGDLEVASVGEIAVLAELASKLAQITDASIKSALGLHHYTAETGASTKALQEWESAARHTTVSAQTVEQSMLGISEQLEDIQRFGAGSNAPIRNLVNTLKDVNFSGLTPNKPEELLKRIRESPIFKRMSAADQFGVLRHAGLGDMLELMQMSQSRFLKYSKETVPMSDREVEKYRQIRDSVATIEAISANIKRLISDWASDKTIDFLKKTAEVLQLELDSLKSIREFFDKRKPGETITSRTSELAPAAAKEIPDVMGRLIRGAIWGALGSYPTLGEESVAPSSQRLIQPATNKSTTVNLRPVVNINGSGLNEHQLAEVAKKAFNHLLQEVAPQINVNPR